MSDAKEWHQVSLSGGKDSTALVLGMYERGYQIDEIVFAEIGMEWEQVYDVLEKVEKITGIPVTVVKPPEDKRFEYLMLEHEITRGERTGTKGYGWPTPLNRWCTTFLKARPLDAHLKQREAEGYNVVSYIGIAYDEAHRTQKNAGSVKLNKRYPLVDWRMTEADCLRFCRDHGIDFGGLYEHFRRISCWCCPLMRLSDARAIYHYYPEKWEKLKQLDAQSRTQFKADYSVLQLEERFKREDSIPRLFD